MTAAPRGSYDSVMLERPYFCRCLSRPGLFLALLAGVAALAPSCGGAVRRGDKAFETGDYGQALVEYESAAVSEPANWEAHYKAGLCHRLLGRRDDARRELSAALAAGGGKEAALALGAVEMELRSYDGAAAAYEKAVAADPKDPVAANNLGVAWHKLGRGMEAEKAVRAAASLAPEAQEIRLNLAVIYDRHLNLPEEAYAQYACYAKLAPEEAQERLVTWRMNALVESGLVPPGASEKSANCPEKAAPGGPYVLADVVPVTELRPTGDPRLAETEALFGQGRFEEAAQAGATVQTAWELSAPGYLLIGLAFARAHDPFKAVPRLQQAVARDPEMADAWYELGWAYEAAGDKETATETWSEGQRRFPGDPRFPLVLRGR